MGVTTVFETKVIGTYINGNYAQILQSTSKIFYPDPKQSSPTIAPSEVTKPQIVSTSVAPDMAKSLRQRHVAPQRHRPPLSDDLVSRHSILKGIWRVCE